VQQTQQESVQEPVAKVDEQVTFSDVADEATSIAEADRAARLRKGGGLELRREDGSLAATITPSTRKGVMAQVTEFDENGKPFGHSDHNSLESALDEANSVFPVDNDPGYRKDIPDDLAFRDKGSTLFVYQPRLRPPGPGTVPKGGLVKTGKGGKHGEVFYDRPLTQQELTAFELDPARFEDVSPKEKPDTPKQKETTDGKPAKPKTKTPRPKKKKANKKFDEGTGSTTTQESAGINQKDDGTISVASIANEPNEKFREQTGTDGLPSHERKTWVTSLNQAKERRMFTPEVTDAMTNDILNGKKKIMDDVESAGMVLRLGQLVNRYGTQRKNLKSAKTDAAKEAIANEMERIASIHERLSDATKLVGTETARSLAFRRLALDENFDPLVVRARAKENKGKPLTDAEKSRLDKSTGELKDVEAKLDKAEKSQNESNADAVRKDARKKNRSRKRSDLNKEASELAAKAKRLLGLGCDDR
jgi:hypothetical protein